MSIVEMSVPQIGVTIDWKVEKAIEIKDKLYSLLFGSGELAITNKTRRKIKKLFNEQVNLTDYMFQGIHTDGQVIGSLDNDEKETELLYHVFKKTPTLSFKKAEKTVRSWMTKYIANDEKVVSYPSKKHELIVTAYLKYVGEVAEKKVLVKTRGLDLVTKCYQYWLSQTIDPVLEEQINKSCDELKTFVISSFDDTFTFGDFAKSLVLVLDISGSMAGIPIETGLFYLFMMVKVFGVFQVHFFESEHSVKEINRDVTSNLELINQIYLDTRGSTELDSVFRHLDTIRTNKKNIVIITDGDCDPNYYGHSSTNPFHEVTSLDKTTSAYPNVLDCNFIVVNVKETELKFPYLNIDPSVCYLTGNNPKTLNGFIKALCDATKSGTMITPDSILKYTLALEELNLAIPVPTYINIMTEERIANLFEVFKKNLPPKKEVKTDEIL